MKKPLLAGVALLVLAGVLTVEVLAQANPNLLINARKGAMTLQGKYFGPVLAMAQGRAPFDAKILQRNADYLAVLSEMPWDDFQPHSLGLKNTRAKEDITMDQEKFRSLATQLQNEVRKLQAAARAGDQDAVKGTATTIARTCNNCHENFSTFDFRFKI